jgi:Skp family chaperone for outer membrane proteins
LIQREFESQTPRLRQEYKGTIDSVISEYNKMLRDVDKEEQSIRKEILLISGSDQEKQHKYDQWNKKLDHGTKSLEESTRTGNEITTRTDQTLTELVNQRRRLENTNIKLGEAEQTLSLHDQIFDVMKNRELYNRLKLVIIVVLLGLANIIVLYIKI